MIFYYYESPFAGRKEITILPWEGMTYRDLAIAAIGTDEGAGVFVDGIAVDIDLPVDTSAATITVARGAGVEMAAIAFAQWVVGASWAAVAGWAAVAYAAAYAVAYATLTYALGKLTSKLLGGGSKSSSEQKIPKDPDSYSLTGGSNNFRVRQPLPIVIGTTRLVPDYGMRPYSFVVRDPDNSRDQTESASDTSLAPAVSEDESGWSKLRDVAYPEYTPGDPLWSASTGVIYLLPITYYTGLLQDGVAQGGAWSTNTFRVAAHDTSTGLYTFYDANTETYGTWQEYAAFHPKVTNQGSSVAGVLEHADLLVNTFNFGFGDLVVSDMRIGQTDLAEFRGVTVSDGKYKPDRTELGTDIDPIQAGWVFPSSIELNQRWPENVIVIEGGELRQNDKIPNEGWVVRSYAGTDAVIGQISLIGRLYYQGNNGPEKRDCTFRVEKSNDNGTTWTLVREIVLQNGDGADVKYSESFPLGAGTPWSIRVKKVDVDSDDSRFANSFNWTTLNVFRKHIIETGKPFSGFPAQRRLGVAIRASGQLNGNLDRFSAKVQAKAYVWTGSGAVSSDFTNPGWTWTTTSNPAWWFLQMARGYFLSRTRVGGAFPPNVGWCVGPENAGGLPRLCGGGFPISRIDLEAVKRFAAHCDAHDLRVDEVITEGTSAHEVLSNILRTGRGALAYPNGKLSIVWESPDDVPVGIVGSGDILPNTLEIAYAGIEIPREVVCSYVDGEDLSQRKEVRVDVLGGYSSAEAEVLFDLWGVQREDQALREARMIAARQQFQRRTIMFDMGPGGFLYTRGDVLLLSLNLIGGYSSRIESMNGSIARLNNPFYTKVPGATQQFVVMLPGSDTPILVNKPVDDVLVDLDIGTTIDFDSLGIQPEDVKVYAGDVLTSTGAVQKSTLHRVRVTAVDVSDVNRIRFSCVDDDPNMFLSETGVGNAEYDSRNTIVARASNPTVVVVGGSKVLTWTLEGAYRALVSITRAGVTNSITVRGTELNLGAAYPSGLISVAVTPVAETVNTRVEPTTALVNVP